MKIKCSYFCKERSVFCLIACYQLWKQAAWKRNSYNYFHHLSQEPQLKFNRYSTLNQPQIAGLPQNIFPFLYPIQQRLATVCLFSCSPPAVGISRNIFPWPCCRSASAVLSRSPVHSEPFNNFAQPFTNSPNLLTIVQLLFTHSRHLFTIFHQPFTLSASFFYSRSL